jgi:hypothetical protein
MQDPAPLIDWGSAKTAGSYAGNFRLIADHGGWVEVETLPMSVFEWGYCQGNARVPGLDGARIRLFARKSDLSPVLSGEYYGHDVGFMPGVLIGSTEEAGWYRVNVHGISGRVFVPDELVACSYIQPKHRFKTSGAVRELFLPTDAPLTIGELTVDDQPPQVSGEGDLRFITHDCVQLTFAKSWEMTESKPGGDGGAGIVAPTEIGTPHVRPGARLYWRGGEEAGEAVFPMTFDRRVERDGSRVCIRRIGRSKVVDRDQVPTAYVELCLSPDDLAGDDG